MILTSGVNINGNFVQYAPMWISSLITHIYKNLCTKHHKNILASVKNSDEKIPKLFFTFSVD